MASVAKGSLTRGTTQSCGCLRRERTAARNAGRADAAPPGEFDVWREMIESGVEVHAAWCRNFLGFVRDVGPRPSPSCKLERIDPAGTFRPDNVRWVARRAPARRAALPTDPIPDDGVFTYMAAVRALGNGGAYVQVPARVLRGLLASGWNWAPVTVDLARAPNFQARPRAARRGVSARIYLPRDIRDAAQISVDEAIRVTLWLPTS